VKINQLAKYGRKAYGHLPEIQVTGMTDPVVQVIDQENRQVLYTLLTRGTSFQPWVNSFNGLQIIYCFLIKIVLLFLYRTLLSFKQT